MKKESAQKLYMPLFIAAALALVGTTGVAQAGSPAAIKSGMGEFQQYCVACHGSDAKGTGPIAKLLEKGVPDLTLLSKKNGGAFPFLKTIETIDGRADVVAHGGKEMPTWGMAFADDAASTMTQGRILNLTLYLESIQAK